MDRTLLQEPVSPGKPKSKHKKRFGLAVTYKGIGKPWVWTKWYRTEVARLAAKADAEKKLNVGYGFRPVKVAICERP